MKYFNQFNGTYIYITLTLLYNHALFESVYFQKKQKKDINSFRIVFTS